MTLDFYEQITVFCFLAISAPFIGVGFAKLQLKMENRN